VKKNVDNTDSDKNYDFNRKLTVEACLSIRLKEQSDRPKMTDLSAKSFQHNVD